MNKITTLEKLFKTLSTGLSSAALNSIKLLSKVSAKITVSRIKRNMTQKEFAEFMDVTQGMVSKWESGGYNFTIKQLCEICAKLDITPNIEFEPKESTDLYLPEKKTLTNLNTNECGQAHSIDLSKCREAA